MGPPGLWSVSALLLLAELPTPGWGIECYRCTYKRLSDRKNRTDPIYPCNRFDGHSKYVTQCPKSTMCEMKTVMLDLPSGDVVTITMRDCADQSFTYRRYTTARGRHEVTDIFADVHAEGCTVEEHLDAIKITRTEHCFCSTDRCNGALRNGPSTGGADAVRWSCAGLLVTLLAAVVR